MSNLRLDKAPFDLDATLCCGQVFRWDKMGDWWYGVAGKSVLKVRQRGEELEFANTDEKFVRRYFGLDDNLRQISRAIGKDAHIRKALEEFWGLRIIRQEPLECLISYICATYKSIPAIKHMLNNLSRKFGEKVVFEETDFFGFPEPRRLARASLAELADCGLGYRAKYVLETSKRIFDDSFVLERLWQMPYEQAKLELCSLPGVGPKVADCVLLFGLGKFEAFPVDVWVKRVLLNHYVGQLTTEAVQRLSKTEGLSNTQYRLLSEFGRGYFGKFAGYAQEYLYHFERLYG